MALDVESVNLGRRLALLNTGAIVPLTHFFDEDGDDTDDVEFAVSCITGVTPCGHYLTVDLRSFDMSPLSQPKRYH